MGDEEKSPLISVVCPFFNEQQAVAKFFAVLLPQLRTLDTEFEIVCVNDGSSDNTLQLLLDARQIEPRIRVLDLSRNFGKEAALTAGLDFAHGDAVIPMDTDLQDPPEQIPVFVQKWREGAEVVLGRRSDRSADSWSKRVSSGLFYKLHNRIAEVALPENVGDFRLMDRRVVEALRRLPERRRFMKGLFAWIGFRTVEVDYVRPPRVAGKSTLNGWTLWNLAIEGITAFSSAPLRVLSYIGLVVALLSFTYAAFIVGRTLVLGIDVPGYASLITIVLFLGGVQLIGLGIIGEYVGRIYAESKQRPIYVVRQLFENNQNGSRDL
ncbi:MAG: glycosyltransferase family 2 protein [Sulfurisoma sp.]|nr:glycosyltransferase family 2 protein [Sulfurisoma sp.]